MLVFVDYRGKSKIIGQSEPIAAACQAGAAGTAIGIWIIVVAGITDAACCCRPVKIAVEQIVYGKVQGKAVGELLRYAQIGK